VTTLVTGGSTRLESWATANQGERKSGIGQKLCGRQGRLGSGHVAGNSGALPAARADARLWKAWTPSCVCVACCTGHITTAKSTLRHFGAQRIVFLDDTSFILPSRASSLFNEGRAGLGRQGAAGPQTPQIAHGPVPSLLRKVRSPLWHLCLPRLPYFCNI